MSEPRHSPSNLESEHMTTQPSKDERTSRRDWERWYAALRNCDPEAFRKAIQAAEGCSITHRLSTKVGADIEVACVMLACDLLGVSI